MMSDERHRPFHLSLAVFLVVLLTQGTKASSFKAGKANITTSSPGLFACKKISFAQPFYGPEEVKMFASFGHSIKSPSRGNGGATWVESEDKSHFTTCVSEYSDGSNGTAEINWIAVQSVPHGIKVGTATLDAWTTGTECKRIDFPQRFLSPPSVLVTPSHQFPQRPQDAMVVWIENSGEQKFDLCFRETKIFDGVHRNIKINWLAFTNLSLDNFTLTDSLAFANISSPSQQHNYAFCQKINFTAPFFAPPVVMVTPKRSNNSNKSHLSARSGCNAITTWVEHTSTTETEICMKHYNSEADLEQTIKVDYVVIGNLDPCLDVTCDHHCLCKAFGPYDARCVSADSCPSFQEPVCSSNGTTYDNKCLFEQEMCQLKLNFTVQHPGSCEGFPFQQGRRHMPHIPSLGYSHCEVIHFRPYIFYPDKTIEVQISVNHIDTTDMSYVHDAAVCWVENVNYHQFTACVMAAGFNERKSAANVTVDWMAYQGAPAGGVSGETRISQWWTGTTCETVNYPSFSQQPSIFATAAHHHAGLKRDAASLWLEDITQSSAKLCLRELQNYAGSHEDIYVKWLAFSSLHKSLFSEHDSVYFANSQQPLPGFNDAFCKDIHFNKVYQNAPKVFVSANHSTSGGNQDPMHNSITAWVEYINTTGAQICLKELYGSKYDPLSLSYTVLSDICQPGWGYFGGYCYFTSSTCASWLAAESNCSTMSSSLVTVHNQEENVYIQHRHNGERSWIGLNDRSVEGSFVWTNKEVSSFRFWAPKQPNNWRDEDCVHNLGAKHGYTWNDVPCKKCYNFSCFTDLDECTTNSYDCDINAACQNTFGSYTCSCNSGYTGGGKVCNDIDECITNSHSCDVNGACNNTIGSYTCACSGGYTGDGRSCSDIDECTSGVHDCHSFASCTNTQGSFSCSCDHPFVGSGKSCSHSASECQNYNSLTSAYRKITYSYHSIDCDSGIGPAWYRFQGAAGSRMVSSCSSTWRCNTHATGWLNGGHPTVADGQVSRTVCFHWSGSCCQWSTTIQVRNCGSFYVYYLSGTPGSHCSLRYCGTD